MSDIGPSDKNHVRLAMWFGVAAILFYGVGTFAADPTKIWDSVSVVTFQDWVVCLVLLLASYTLRFWRWHEYLKILRHKIPVVRNAAFYLAGFAFTATPAKIGEGMRSLLLKSEGVSYSDSLAAFFAERFSDVVVLTILAASMAYQYEVARWPVLAFVVALVLLSLVVYKEQFHVWAENWAARLTPGKVGFVIARLVGMMRLASGLLKRTILVKGLAIGFVAWIAEAMIFGKILHAMSVDLSTTYIVAIWAASMLVGAASMLPGGLGSTEAVMTGLLVYQGVDGSVAFAATLAYRIATLWFAVIGGMAILAVVNRKFGHNYRGEPGTAEGGLSDET